MVGYTPYPTYRTPARYSVSGTPSGILGHSRAFAGALGQYAGILGLDAGMFGLMWRLRGRFRGSLAQDRASAVPSRLMATEYPNPVDPTAEAGVASGAVESATPDPVTGRVLGTDGVTGEQLIAPEVPGNAALRAQRAGAAGQAQAAAEQVTAQARANVPVVPGPNVPGPNVPGPVVPEPVGQDQVVQRAPDGSEVPVVAPDAQQGVPLVDQAPDSRFARIRVAARPDLPLPTPEAVSADDAGRESTGDDQPAVNMSTQNIPDPNFVDEDIIGTLRPGDVGGRAYLVVRLLGGGDNGVYSGGPVERVKQLQREAGLEPNGWVAGPTWALILRGLRLGNSGEEVLILSRLLGLSDRTVFDQEMQERVLDLQARAALNPNGQMDADTWYAAISMANAERSGTAVSDAPQP